MTESEAWALAEDGLERRDYTQVLVACDRLEELGLETEAQCLRWYARKGHQRWGLNRAPHFPPSTKAKVGWIVDFGDPYEDTYRPKYRNRLLKDAVLSLAEERAAELEFYSD